MTDYDKLVAALRCENAQNVAGPDCAEYGCYANRGKGLYCQTAKLLSDAADAIEALQAQLPKRGEWVEANTRPRSAQFYCSVCHRTCYDIQPTRDKAWTKRCRYQFCPNCGADMRKMEVQE